MNSAQTLYPRLPDILDEESLATVGTLESRERHFACSRGQGRQHYLRALYLKAFRALGHGHLQPIDVPRQLRLRILEQLGQDKALADIRTIDRRERSRILADVRAFLNARAASSMAKQEVEAWLRGDLAQREGDTAVLTSAAIERFQQTNIELPALKDISAMAERALRAANTLVENAISKALAAAHAEKLSSLIDGTAPNTFERFKEPAPSASPQTLQRELLRLQELDAWMPNAAALATVSRRKMEQLANLAKRYNTAELLQLRGAKRRAVLACFLAVRRAEILDDLADMFIRTWENAKASADSHAEQALKALEAEREYLFTVKDNQSTLLTDIRLLFEGRGEPNFREPFTLEHGRLESRAIWTSAALNDYLDFPYVGQVFVIERTRIEKKTGKESSEAIYGLTDHTPESADPPRVLAFNRGHWAIEAHHYILDWNGDEDRCTLRTGHGPENITRLRRFATGLINAKSSDSVAATIAKLARNLRRVFDLRFRVVGEKRRV